MRMTTDEKYMRAALKQAEKAYIWEKPRLVA